MKEQSNWYFWTFVIVSLRICLGNTGIGVCCWSNVVISQTTEVVTRRKTLNARCEHRNSQRKFLKKTTDSLYYIFSANSCGVSSPQGLLFGGGYVPHKIFVFFLIPRENCGQTTILYSPRSFRTHHSRVKLSFLGEMRNFAFIHYLWFGVNLSG